MCSSAVVCHLPQGSTCCAIWDVFLLTMVVKNYYLNFHSLPVISKQPGHSLLTSVINKMFPPAELLLSGWFLVSHCCAWTFSVSENLKPAHLATTSTLQSKSLSSHFLLFDVNVNWSSKPLYNTLLYQWLITVWNVCVPIILAKGLHNKGNNKIPRENWIMPMEQTLYLDLTSSSLYYQDAPRHSSLAKCHF